MNVFIKEIFMPKVIEGVRESILSFVRESVKKGENPTIEKIARHCGIANGTVFNYFPSKDMILATVILEDWTAIFAHMEKKLPAANKGEGLDFFYESLKGFCKKYKEIWASSYSDKGVQSALQKRHVPLRDQVGALLKQILPSLSEALYPILAETLLLLARDDSLSYPVWKEATLSLLTK